MSFAPQCGKTKKSHSSKIYFVIVTNDDEYGGHRCGSSSVCMTFVGVSIASLFLSLVGNLLGMEASANSRRALHDDLVKGLLRKPTHDNVHFEGSILSTFHIALNAEGRNRVRLWVERNKWRKSHIHTTV